LVADDAGQSVFNDGASGASEDIADEKNSHELRRRELMVTPSFVEEMRGIRSIPRKGC
jgi:hypothetical protein